MPPNERVTLAHVGGYHVESMRLGLPAITVVAFTACSFDWDRFDPSIAGAGAAGGGGGGTGGSAGSSQGGTAGAGGDGGASGGSGGEGGGVLGPWSTPQPVAVLNSALGDDDDPTFTGDGLELYFNTDREGGHDIWVSRRLSTSEPWQTPEPATALNSESLDGNCVIAPDGLTLWLSSQRDGQANGDIYVSTRLDRTSAWEPPVRADDLSADGASDYPSSVSPDGLTFVFERNGDLYTATRAATSAPWTNVTPIDELNTADRERQAWLAPDGLALYYDSDGAGSVDLLLSTRASTSDLWGTPAPIVELATLTDGESDAWLSADQRYMLFTKEDAGGADIYQTSR